MKSLEAIKNLRDRMFKAGREYRQAIVQNLKEYGGELEVINDEWSEDDGYPRGVKVTSIGNNDETFSCVVDKICYEEGEVINKVGIHVVWYDYNEDVDEWWGLDDLIGEAADYVVSCIQWPEEVENAEQEEEKMMILCSYDEDEQEFDEHLIVAIDVLHSPNGKQRIRKKLNERFEYDNMDDDDRKEFRKCVKDLLAGKPGYFGIRYFWEEEEVLQ